MNCNIIMMELKSYLSALVLFTHLGSGFLLSFKVHSQVFQATCIGFQIAIYTHMCVYVSPVCEEQVSSSE